MPMNIPWTSVIVFVACLAAIVFLVSSGHSTNATVTVLIGLLPSLVAAGYAERTSRDVRNGVVEQKVKVGARAALDETGVTAVAAQSGESTKLAMLALSKLLETNTAATNANTIAQSEGGNPNGGQTV
jgi:hypothetical protein